ncbi:hypothetical protein H5P28_07580 [Ruficoccus amylovorans]|uniref:Uncharacterized protein n=1 Tax=Ruficoccus amylovorans TaxID=1804625 RepID=A0A842HCH5_9BACT|nr:hypothetical protein [Ruficoccus amylovorans]MBC2594122.1 hypothetical protein [Ruficoccus amylovorans]
MHRGMGCAGLVCGVFGLAAGLSALFFNYFVSPGLDYDSPLNDLTTVFWLFNTLLIGLAVCFVSGGLMMKDSPADKAPAPGAPPPLPVKPQPAPVAFTPARSVPAQPVQTPTQASSAPPALPSEDAATAASPTTEQTPRNPLG